MRMTRQRQAVLDVLRSTQSHPTGDEVYRLARRRLPRISLGTVYRNLEVLSSLGLVQKIETAGRPRRFDGRREQHSHIRCLQCGRMADLAAAAPARSRGPRGLPGWEVVGRRFELLGLCPRCRSAKPRAAALSRSATTRARGGGRG